MSTAFSIRKTSQFLSDRERVANRRQDAELIEEPDLADAEEQEIAELWAADTGNQGA